MCKADSASRGYEEAKRWPSGSLLGPGPKPYPKKLPEYSLKIKPRQIASFDESFPILPFQAE